MSTLLKIARILFAIIFWTWNALFLFLIAFGFAPFVFAELLADAFDGLAQWSTVGWSALLFFLPVVVVVATILRLRRDPTAMFVAFFGVEVPGLTLATFRVFGLPDLHGAAGYTLAGVVVGCFVLLAHLAGVRRARPLVHAGLAVLVVASAYLGFVLAFITLPVLVEILLEVGEELVTRPTSLVFASLPALWACLTVLAVLLAPVTTPIAALRALLRSHRGMAQLWGPRASAALAAVPAALLVAVIASGWHQPHEGVLDRLAQPPRSDAERQALVDDADDIRAGLIDAYLARQRYFSDNRDDTVDDVLRDAGGAPEWLQHFHHWIARPFLFDGVARDVHAPASTAYRNMFGEEIERTEGAAIRDAFASNVLRDQRYAGFIDQGQQRVWLAAQHVSVVDRGGYAEVEIADTWMNQTAFPEEVLLMFSLPPDAALTGLWLGSDADKSKAFRYVVAPRGAAQQVYNEQVRQRRDPALLEQVGPQQYRLRVFPVPARERRSGRVPWASTKGAWHDVDETRPRMHVWLRYEALPAADGTVPWPQLAERRNGFWDDDTERTVTVRLAEQNVDADDSDADDGERWVQADPVALTVAANGGLVRAGVAGACYGIAPLPDRPNGLAGKRIDVVVDRSFEMARHQTQLQQLQAQLQAAGPARTRYVMTSGAFRGEPPSLTDKLEPGLAFASTSPREMLQQWAQLTRGAGDAADVVIVLAGQGSFDVAVDGALDIPLGAPIFLVHLGGLPAGYDDGTIDAVAKSGGTAVDARDFADVVAAGAQGAQRRGLIVAGKRFGPADGCASDGSGPRGIVGRLAIRLLDRERRQDDASTLDALHAVAREASVVTPYSSMIVLVDEEQRRRLAELEKQKDRFEREVEQHKEMPSSAMPDIMGAPEPHEYALLALTGAFALYALYEMRRRRRMA